MTALTQAMTADQLLKLPRDEGRCELVKGELIRMSPASARHGQITGCLHSALHAHVAARGLGVVCAAETGFLLARDPDTVRGPDVSFVARERIPAGGVPEGYWPFAPDLAAEVISPGDTVEQVESKVQEYLAAGTRAVWVVHPKTQSVTVYRSLAEIRVVTGGEFLDGGEVVPGFRIRVSQLFEP